MEIIGDVSEGFLIVFCCITIVPITLLGIGVMLNDYFSYRGGGSEPNEFTQL